MDAEVRVVIPAHPRFLRIARLTAAAVAGDLGFGLQDIEDLRVAVDEMSAVLIEDAEPSTELELTYRVAEGVLEVEGRSAPTGPVPELHPVARELLSMTADEFAIESDGDGRRFRMVKRRADLPV